MAKIYGGKSKYLIKNDLKFFAIGDFIIPVLFTVLFFYIFKIAINLMNLKINSYILPIIIFFFIFFINNFGKDTLKLQWIAKKISNNFFLGRKGEDEVVEVLKNLSDNYTIFRNINLYKKGDIDLVLLGPCGLLAIEVKNYKGNIIFENGKLKTAKRYFRKDFIKQTKNEALDLNYYLKENIERDIFVKPVLVFSNKHVYMRFGLNPVNNIFVIQKGYLIKLIESLPEVISREEATEIEQELSLLYK